MKKAVLFLLVCITGRQVLFAQTPADAIRNGWLINNGTARNMAIGGAMGSLGGDISASHVNPAGIGMYKTREFVFSPGINVNNNKFNFRGTDSSGNKNAFTLGTSGFIVGTPSRNNGGWVSSAFSISINQLANYNNRLSYSGINNYSSFSEQYVEELAKDNASPLAAEQNYIFGSSLAYRTYLVDSFMQNGIINYKSLVEDALPGGLRQQYNAVSSGAFNELAIAYAGNYMDKFYLGATLGVPIVFYDRTLTYREQDISGNAHNNFNYFEYTENFRSRGFGFNVKVGAIYKPVEYIRLGLAFHSGSRISFKDEIRSSMTTDTEDYAHTLSESSDNLNSGNAGERKYFQSTPWRMIASGSYVFREVENTQRQKGFITADVEYVNYRAMRFSSTDEADAISDQIADENNDAIKNIYKPNFNFRLGGELKFNTWMFRLGGAYYGSPYKSNELKANRYIGSGGIGYRNYGFFIDLTYSQQFINDVNQPYVLNDKANTFATQTGSRGSVIATVGYKF